MVPRKALMSDKSLHGPQLMIFATRLSSGSLPLKVHRWPRTVISAAHKVVFIPKCSSTIFHSLYNLVEVLKVFPDKSTDSWIFGYGFWLTVFLNIHGSRSFDRNIVDVWLGHMRYFGLQNMGDIVMEYWY